MHSWMHRGAGAEPERGRRFAAAARRGVERMFAHSFPAGIVGVAFLGTLLILFREVNYGVGIWSDSLSYMLRAKRMLAGPGWLVSISGIQPPFYSLLLALLGTSGFDLVRIAGLVNAAAFGLTILLSGLWLKNRLDSRLIVLWAAAAIMLSVPLTNLAAQVMSEPVCILFLVLALMRTEEFLRPGHSGERSSLTWAALFSSLAFMTRYVGGAVVPVVATLLLIRKGASLTEKTRQAAVYSAISIAPVGLWALRNFLLSGAPTWDAFTLSPPRTLLSQNLVWTFEALADWTFPLSRPGNPAVLPMLCLLSAAAAGCMLRPSGSQSGSASGVAARSDRIFLLFSSAYVVLFVASGFVVEIEEVNFSRYLSLIYVPMVIAAALAADRLLTLANRPGRGRLPKTAGAVLIGSMFLWLHYPALEGSQATIAYLDSGFVYTSARWRNHDVLEYLARNPVDDPVHTNRDELVEFSTGLRTRTMRERFQLDEALNGPPAFIVYLRETVSADLAPRIESLPEVETKFRGRDGGVHHFALRGRRSLDEITRESEPVIRSDRYDVYLDEDRLVYLRNAPARDDAAGLRFFLHVVPAKAENLHWARKWLGRRQFDWGRSCTWRSDGRCAVVVGLPQYDVASIRTGQYRAGPNREYGDLTYGRSVKVAWSFITTGRFALEEHVWEGEYRLP